MPDQREGYHRLLQQVVSKCALRDKKEEGPGFPETSQQFSIVSCQLSPQVLFQIIKPYRLYFRQHFFQHCALLNEPPCPCLLYTSSE